MRGTTLNDMKELALAYHAASRPGKIEISTTKPMHTAEDLALAYSPGVAEPSLAIVRDPALAARYTARSNLVGVITNGTAVLGLGPIGALAAKPVMEGKVALFKRFADVDAFDIEIDENDPDRLVDIIASLAPTFGGINLEDIRAPECFYVERKLRERLSIPVFHDDQHGTAIVVCAGLLNALRLTGREPARTRVVVSGAGAAALACLDMMLQFGFCARNIRVFDSRGLLTRERQLDATKRRWACTGAGVSLGAALVGADLFLGLSTGGVLTPEMVRQMAARPIVFALANPEPEIRPELVYAILPDAIVATGRSDYPNQVNNALCFPYLFRAALDAGVPSISRAMMLACANGLAEAARGDPRFGVRQILPELLADGLRSALVSRIMDAAGPASSA